MSVLFARDDHDISTPEGQMMSSMHAMIAGQERPERLIGGDTTALLVPPPIGGSADRGWWNPRVPFRFAPLHPWLTLCRPPSAAVRHQSQLRPPDASDSQRPRRTLVPSWRNPDRSPVVPGHRAWSAIQTTRRKANMRVHTHLVAVLAIAVLLAGLACQPTQQPSEQTSQVAPALVPTEAEGRTVSGPHAATPPDTAGDENEGDWPLRLSLAEAEQGDGQVNLQLRVTGEPDDPSIVDLVTVYMTDGNKQRAPEDLLLMCGDRPGWVRYDDLSVYTDLYFSSGNDAYVSWVRSEFSTEADGRRELVGTVRYGGGLDTMVTEEGTIELSLGGSKNGLGLGQDEPEYSGKGIVHIWLKRRPSGNVGPEGDPVSNTLEIPVDFDAEPEDEEAE